MKNGFFAVLFDSIGIFLLAGFVFFCFLRLVFPYNYSLVLGLLLGGVITPLFAKFKLKRVKNTQIKLKDKKLFEDTLFCLNVASFSQQNKLIKALLIKNDQKVKIISRGVYCFSTKTLYVCRFGFYKVTKTDVVKIYNYSRIPQKFVIIGQEFNQEVMDFAKRFNGKIELMDAKQFFERLKNAQLLPLTFNKDFLQESKKPHVFAGLKNRKNAKVFLLCGLYFLAMSFLVPIKTFYVLWGGFMLLIWLFICYFAPKKTD